MFGAIGSFIGGLGQTLLGDSLNRRNSAEAHDWATEDAHIARQWQERMSNTAHQREVGDLRAAGLNPILSATGGAGAPVGGGAMPSVDKADSPDTGFMTSALGAIKNSAEMKLMKAQEEVASTAADVNRAQEKKTSKEADILGPKSYLFDKITEGLKSGAKMLTGDDHPGNANVLKQHEKAVGHKVHLKGKP